MYTLEKHLEVCSSSNPEVALLNSIWNLNKRFIPNAQNAISFNFPHYSLHEKSHSQTIVKNIESFLGEDRIKILGPTDTWLILMAAFTHDLGMVVFHSALEKKWTESDFQDYIKQISLTSSDVDLQKAAILVLSTQSIKPEPNIKLTLPLEIRKAVILITADFFRRNHHLRSKEMISGVDEEFSKLINGFNLSGLPGRFTNTLAEIAYAHGIDFYSVMDKLEYTADGFGSDKMHPRFIACLLRLGDLLDVDDKRFNVFTNKTFTNELPTISQQHSEKHAAVKHLLISPRSIEITVDCQSDDVYRIAREWFDWLQSEVSNQSREWTNIAPSYLKGMPPTISRGKIKVLYRSSTPPEGLMNLRFSISNQKVFEIFEGSAIYEKTEFVFIREVVQNAIDASKIQLWRLILSGAYDFILREHLSLSENTPHEQIINSIKYPIDLPSQIWENFQVDLKIYWRDESTLAIEVEDHGTGISERDLIRMTKNVGESRNNDADYITLKKSMPYWLKPTGAFGIGLQSIFLVADNFKIHTKPESEKAKEIIFHSAKRNQYSMITRNEPVMNRGTRVLIDINKEAFPDVFSTSFDINIIDNYDFFTDKYGDIYPHKILNYISTEFRNVSNLNVFFFGEKVKTASKIQGEKDLINLAESVRNENIYAILPKDDSRFESNYFLIYENLGVGSDLGIMFNNYFPEKPGIRINEEARYERSEYFVRDIPVKHTFPSFYRTKYCYVQWNFQSPESDKILNISRDKFITKTQNKFSNIFLDTILPTSLEIMINLFERKISHQTEISEKTAIEYFHLELTAQMCNVSCNHRDDIYGEYTFPTYLLTDSKQNKVKLADFFKANKIIHVQKDYIKHDPDRKETIQQVFEGFIQQHNLSDGIVLWNEDYLNPYFRLGDYHLSEENVYRTEDGLITVKILERNKQLYTPVATNALAEKMALHRVSYLQPKSGRRRKILPLKTYAPNLAVKSDYDGFYSDLRNVHHYIISPFSSLDDYKRLLDTVKQLIEQKDKTGLKRIVKTSFIQHLVPPKMQEWIIENSSMKRSEDLSRELIIDSYVDLIADSLLLSFDDDTHLDTHMKVQRSHFY